MIHSTKNDQYWLFWCQWWSDPQDQNLFWGNWHLEAVEAAEVAEAAEINEAGEVSKGLKNHYCGLQKSSRFLNPIFWGLYFDVLKKKSFDRILKTHIESYHLYCRRPLRLCGVKTNSYDWSGINFYYSGSHWASVFGTFVKTSGQARSLLCVKT